MWRKLTLDHRGERSNPWFGGIAGEAKAFQHIPFYLIKRGVGILVVAPVFQTGEGNSIFPPRSILWGLRIMASMPDSHSGDKSSILLAPTMKPALIAKCEGGSLQKNYTVVRFHLSAPI